MSTPAEKIEAQRVAFESQPWNRHLIGPAELEILLAEQAARNADSEAEPKQDERNAK